MGKLWKISSPFREGASVSWNVRGSKSGEKAVHGQGRLFTGGGQGHACSQEAAGRRRPQFGVPCRCRGGLTLVPQVRGKSDDKNQVLSPSPVPQSRVHLCQPGSSCVPRTSLHGCRTVQRCPGPQANGDAPALHTVCPDALTAPQTRGGAPWQARRTWSEWRGASARGMLPCFYQNGVQSPVLQARERKVASPWLVEVTVPGPAGAWEDAFYLFVHSTSKTQVPQESGKSNDENQVLSSPPVPQTRVHPCQPGSSDSWEEWPSAGALCTGVLPWARRLKRVPPHLRGRLAASGRKREAHA